MGRSRGWREIIFGKQAQKEHNNIDTNSTASSSPSHKTNKKNNKNGLSKLNILSAFRPNSNNNNDHTIHTHTNNNNNAQQQASSRKGDNNKMECQKEEILLQWEAPSPAGRSCTPPPLSKLRKNLSSLFHSSSVSTPSSPRPRSPSPFSFFKSSFLSTQNRCGICGESMKRLEGEREIAGTTKGSVFTADCSHSFHSRCVSNHFRQENNSASSLLTCPLCSVPWSQPPFMATFDKPIKPQAVAPSNTARHKVYSDDEPLCLSTTPLSSHSPSGTGQGFNPIPEAEEEELETNSASDQEECSTTPNANGPTSSSSTSSCSIVASVRREVALVASGRRHVSYVVAVRVKAPPIRSATSTQRAPMDLVTVLELGQTIDKMQTLKQAIRPIIASMGPADRLSLVAFSGSTTKRLMPLRRMTKQGQRSARQIVDRLAIFSNMQQGHAVLVSANDALKKAKRVLEDRRECNPVATIMLLSENNLQQQQASVQAHNKHDKTETDRNQHETNRFVEFPLGSEGEEGEETLKKCMGGLGGAVMQDVRLQFVLPVSEGEVTAVYCYSSDGSGAFAGTGGTGPSIRLGDLYAEQEIELLLELRVPLNRRNPLSFCIKCTYRDPVTMAVSSGVEQPPLLLPPAPVHNSSLHLRNLFVTCRAVTESRRLVGLNDLATALHLLYSAQSLLLQSPPSVVQHLIPNIEAELVEIQRRRGQQQQYQQQQMLRQRQEVTMTSSSVEGESHPLTPTSAWRAAEQLAKVAIMRKSQNRVSDLHGFENARF